MSYGNSRRDSNHVNLNLTLSSSKSDVDSDSTSSVKSEEVPYADFPFETACKGVPQAPEEQGGACDVSLSEARVECAGECDARDAREGRVAVRAQRRSAPLHRSSRRRMPK